jgi:hypothetical protein
MVEIEIKKKGPGERRSKEKNQLPSSQILLMPLSPPSLNP